MKRGVGIFFICLISLSFISAGWFSDIFTVTGKAVDAVCGNGILEDGEICDYASNDSENNPYGDQCTTSCWINGISGSWQGCRGSGAHVCVDAIGENYEFYFEQNPLCVPNNDCSGLFYTCNGIICPELMTVQINETETYCCEKTFSGSWCANYPQEECLGEYKISPTSCENTTFCALGFCYNAENEICSEMVPRAKCEYEGGVWTEEEDCGIPVNETMGSCIDSDGGLEYGIYGECIVSYENSAGMVADRCENGSLLKECFCSDGLESIEYYCDYGCEDGACIRGNETNQTQNPVCQGLIDKVINPKDFTAENGFLYYGSKDNIYEGRWYFVNGEEESATTYSAYWSTSDYDTYFGLSYHVSVFDNLDVNLEELMDYVVEEIICKPISFFGADNVEHKIYICNWDVLYPNKNIELYESESRNIVWYNDNVLVQIDTHTGRQLSEEELIILVQNSLQEFMSDLQSNDVEYFGDWEYFDLGYVFESVISEDLVGCSSDISLNICTPFWECQTSPTICPPHGIQTRTCVDYGNCYEDRISSSQCNPGICSGCMIPKWFGKGLNERCIPYGFRFEQDTDDFVEQLMEVENQEHLEEFDDGEVSLVVISDSKAILNFYFENGTYENILVPGETIELNVPEGYFEEFIEFTLTVDDIYFDMDGESYVDITLRYNYMGEVMVKMDAYCGITGKVGQQKNDLEECQNDYECMSNECSYGECVSVLKELKTQAGFMKQLGCRLLSVVSVGTYDYKECLGEESSVGSSGGGVITP